MSGRIKRAADLPRRNGNAAVSLSRKESRSVHGNNGSITGIDFDNTLHSFSFAGGTFTMQVFDVSKFAVDKSNSIAGQIVLTSVAPVPDGPRGRFLAPALQAKRSGDRLAARPI